MSFWKSLLKVTLKITISSVVITSSVLLLLYSSVFAEQEGIENKRVVIILLGDLSLEDYVGMDNVLRLMNNGAVGLVNIRGAVKTDVFSSYASIGAGTRADADLEHSEAYIQGGRVISKSISKLKEYNKNNPYNASIGALGDFLHLRGYKTAIISYPYIDMNFFPGVLIASDSNGIIDSGEIFYNSFKQKNSEKILEAFTKLYSMSNLIVIDIGNIDDNEIISKSTISNLVGQISKKVGEENNLLIVNSVFYDKESAVDSKKLVPIVITGPEVERGLLFSDTTRRPGIIGNIDIAPTIAKYFNGTLDESQGRPLKIKRTEKNIQIVSFLCDLTSFNSRARSVVLKGYISFQIIILFSSLLFILLRFNKVLFSSLRFTILSVLFFPFTLLIMPLFKITDLMNFIFFVVLINLMVTYIINRVISKDSTKVITIAGITSLALIADLIFGGNLNKSSLFGYDAIIGARYYGLGNEYMGILISALLISVVPLISKHKFWRFIVVILLFSTLPVIGLSAYGANVGGTITASAAFLYVVLYLYDQKINFKNIFLAILIITFMITVFALYDIYLSPQKSHLAKALMDIKTNGYFVIYDIIKRKISMNIKLLKWTIWSRVLLVSIFVMAVLFLKRGSLIYKLFKKYGAFFCAWSGIVIASFIGMLVNDSGVVVAATSNIFLIFSILYFVTGGDYDGIRGAWQNGN